MSQRSKREMIEAIRPRYLKANKASKERANTGGTHCDNWIPSEIRHPGVESRSEAQRIEPAGAKKEVPRGGHPGFGADLGDLWSDLFQEVTALPGRRDRHFGTMP
jgi:hypothetical protein